LKISNLNRKDIDCCAFLLKLLKAAKYEIEGTAVADMHQCYSWVQNLSVDIADGWNAQNKPPEDSGMKNVKITNPKV
jgi:hypothetical protein